MTEQSNIDLTLEEFTERFVAHMTKIAGFERFDDGTPVAEYAREAATASWSDTYYREDGPEACAESDMDYWGEG